jgi:hypothetical protein
MVHEKISSPTKYIEIKSSQFTDVHMFTVPRIGGSRDVGLRLGRVAFRPPGPPWCHGAALQARGQVLRGGQALGLAENQVPHEKPMEMVISSSKMVV